MIAEKIKTETREVHAALEKLIVPKIKNADTTSYIRLLYTFYGFYKPVEDCLDVYISDDVVPEYKKRRKAAAILDDIQFMSGSSVPCPVASRLPEIGSRCQAMGAMYVLEGSALGGRIITKMLQQKLPFDNGNGIKFFSGYAGDSEAMWRSFITVLDTFTLDPAEQDVIVRAGLDTFVTFRNWIEECDVRGAL